MNNTHLDILTNQTPRAFLKENVDAALKRGLTERDIIIGEEEIKTLLAPLRHLAFLTIQTKHLITKVAINQTGQSIILKWQTDKDHYAFIYREDETVVHLKKNHIKLNPMEFKTQLEVFRDLAETWLENTPYELYHHCYRYQ